MKPAQGMFGLKIRMLFPFRLGTSEKVAEELMQDFCGSLLVWHPTRVYPTRVSDKGNRPSTALATNRDARANADKGICDSKGEPVDNGPI